VDSYRLICVEAILAYAWSLVGGSGFFFVFGWGKAVGGACLFDMAWRDGAPGCVSGCGRCVMVVGTGDPCRQVGPIRSVAYCVLMTLCFFLVRVKRFCFLSF